MNTPITALLLAAGLAGAVHAQVGQIVSWRCANNYYTGDRIEAERLGCKPVEGGNITIVAAPKAAPVRVAAAPQAAPANTAAREASRVDSAEQRQRDSDARAILEAELRKAESRLAELQKEYNNGEPEKLGPEHRNPQKYIDRVAELKAGIARAESDIAGIRRELGRVGMPAASAAGAAAK